MAIELATAVVQIIPSARGIEKNLANELAPVSGIAAAEGTKAGKALGGNVAKGLNDSIGKLSGLAAGFGVPFAAQLATINSRFDLTSAKASTFAATLANIGKTELVAAGVGLAVVGTSAVHAADQFEISRARLETAVTNTGGSFEEASKGVGTLDDSFVKLGFNTSDTEDALSRLTVATGSVAKATQLMGTAADIARARNIPLVQATDLLSKAALGNYIGLRRLGIASKDQIASFHSLADVTDFLAKKFGGQAAAFADTFAGKMAALKAQANQLEVTIGSALIPKIESLAQITISGVQGFEHLNAATDGWLGKVTLGLSVLPATVFLLEKLNSAAASVAGQYGKVGDAIGVTAAATEGSAAADEVSAAAKVPLITAYQAEAAATLESVAADRALEAIQFELAQADQVETAALVELTAATEAAAAAKAHLAEASATSAAAGGGGAAAAGGAGVLGVGALPLELITAGTIGSAVGNAKLDDSVRQMSALGKAAVVTGEAFLGTFIPGAHVLTAALGFLGVGHKKNADATKEDTLASLKDALAKAQEKLANDSLAGNTKALAGDKANVASINKKLTGAEQVVADAMGNSGAAAVKSGSDFAYLGKNIKTAADALDAINAKAFSGIRGKISVDTAQTGVQDAIDALNNPDAGSSSGGGGGGETATAKALDAIQKNLTLRDSERGIAQASQAVKDAQEQLTHAQQDQTTATAALKTAQENYRTTLQGVARDSKAAKDATDALTQAQNDKAGAALDVNAAKRALATAKNDKDLLALAVKDARDKLAQDKGQGAGSQFVETPTGSKQISSGGADAETTRKDQIALNDAIIAQTGANDSVKRAELDLSNARLAAKQKTQDAAEAQRVYNGTINGFPPASAEAKAAQQQLTDAQRQAETAADGVRQAQDQLTTATNGTADAYLALLRAQADVDGKLTASTGAAAAGKKLDSLKTRTDAAVTAILGLADASEKADIAAGHSFGYSIQQEIGVLRAYAAANPLLAHAFDGALAELQAQFNSYVDKQIQKTGVDITAFQHPGRASGGPVLGSDPSGIPILAHPGEYVVRASAVQKYGAMTMERLNAGSLPMYADGGRVSAHTLANSRPRDGWGGGDTYIVHGETIEERRIGTVIVKALQQHTSDHGYIPRVKVGG